MIIWEVIHVSSKTGFNQKKSHSREPFAFENSNNFVIPLDFKG